jgi:hypothetical protein
VPHLSDLRGTTNEDQRTLNLSKGWTQTARFMLRPIYVEGTGQAMLYRSAGAVTHINTISECGSLNAAGNSLPDRPATPLRIAINSIFGNYSLIQEL